MTRSIATLCGSLRKGSFNAQLLSAASDIAPEDWRLDRLSGLGDVPLYNQDVEENEGFPEPVTRLADAIHRADGLIIVTPEYNFGVPGVLKNALDWLSRLGNQPFEGLPVSIMSASPSPMGGIRAQYQLRQIFVAVNADVTARPEVAVAFAHDRFKNGRLVDVQTHEVIRDHLAAFEAVLARHERNPARAA